MSSLPRFLSEGILGNLVGSSPSSQASPPTGISRSFELFIQAINKVSNKYEEKQIVQRELQTIQQNISNPNTSQLQMRDYLTRIVYCHMLGYDISWSCIHAVKLAQQGTQLCKKIGYLSCCLLLHRDHDLILLLINTIQKDLKSSNLLDNMAALSAASQLVPAEIIPALLPVVLDKLKHSSVLVRQKAVMCLHQFYLLAPDLLDHNYNDIHRSLLDKDPGVVAAYLHILQNDIQRSPDKHLTTGTILIKILTQLTMVKMDPKFDFHGIPFLWLRIHLIRCLSFLASSHQSLRKELSEVLEKILLRVNLKGNMTFALLYECISCIATICPGPKLLDEAAKHVGRFLKSSDPNLKLIGVKSLVKLVQADKQYATEYQDLIVQSLEHADTSVQRKMYKVLFQISHEGNVEAIAAQMLQQLFSSTDKYWRSEVISMVTDMASRYSEKADWQVETLFQCVQLGGQEVDVRATDLIMSVFQKGYMEADSDLKRQQVLVQKSVSALMSRDATAVLIHISAWVLGELCCLLKNISEDKLLSLVIKHMCNTQLSYLVKSYILSTVHKLLGNQLVSHRALETSLQECLATSQPTVIKQRILLLVGVCRCQAVQQLADSLTIDTTLSFLDEFVSDDLEHGGAPFIPAHMRGMTASQQTAISSYTDDQGKTEAEVTEEEVLSVETRPRTCSTTSSAKTSDDREAGLMLSGVKQVWSKTGRLEFEENTVTSKSPVNQPISEEEKRQKELSSALFAGLPFREKKSPEIQSPDSGGLLSNTTDSGGWRKLHDTAKAANSLINTPDIPNTNKTDNSTLSKTLIANTLLPAEVQDKHSDDLTERVSIDSDLEGKNETKETKELEGTLEDSLSIQSSELSAVLNDNSGYLNISMCSNDDSRVSVSYLGGDSSAAALGEISIRRDSSESLDNMKDVVDPGEQELKSLDVEFGNSPKSDGKDAEDSGFEMGNEFSLSGLDVLKFSSKSSSDGS